MSEPKTLLPEIANSPYFVKYPGRNFSQILFKPGYPLQSAELISLQNILNEQIKRFGDHIFKDGSIVSSTGGIDFDNCQLYELADGANTSVTAGSVNSTVVFTTNINDTAATVLEGKFIAMKEAFVEDGIVYPIMIGLKFPAGFPQNTISTLNEVKVYIKESDTNFVEVGTLANSTPRAGKYGTINSSIFYVSGYFTNIAPQTYIFGVENIPNLNREVGVELVWEIADITDPVYGTQLFDPAENAFNENSPGADRLILRLQLADHPLNYTQTDSDWKFVPLLKFKDGNLVYRVKYPVYSVLGETLARRTYEINGNFVVDNFKLNIESDSELAGTHLITNTEVITAGEEIVYTIVGTNTNYNELSVNNYLMFGTDIDFNRLLKIIDIESNNRIRVSDIHYDPYNDAAGAALLLANQNIVLRDEEKLNYVLSEGKAYVKGYRFETTFNTKLEDVKARETDTVTNLNITTNEHYFELENFVHTENFIDFDELSLIDMHCTFHKELYNVQIELGGGFTSDITIGIGNVIDINGTKFEAVSAVTKTGGILSATYRITEYSKNSTDGLPIVGQNYIVINTNTNENNTYTLRTLTKLNEAPFVSNTAESYVVQTVSDNTANTASISSNGYSINFTRNSAGYYNTEFDEGDYVIIRDSNGFVAHGYVNDIPTTVSTTMTVDTNVSVLDPTTTYIIEKPSYADYYNYQYNSTKIGTIRANSVGVYDKNRFRYSHYKLDSTPKQFVVTRISGSTIRGIGLNLSVVDDVYNGMHIENNGRRWEIEDYNGSTQEFTLSNVSLINPINFSVGDTVDLTFYLYNIKSIVKSDYINGTEFYGNIKQTNTNYPTIKTPNQTQKKFARVINEGEGEVKAVRVDSYDLFYQQKWTNSGGVTNQISNNIGTNYAENYDITNDYVKVYAAKTLYDTSNGYVKYHKGELIPITSAIITSYNFQIVFADTFENNDEFIVQAVIPVSQPNQRTKDLQTFTDTLTVYVNKTTADFIIDDVRYLGDAGSSFVLNHSDVYRIRKILVGVGKATPTVDLTNYFDLDTGQRDTHYDRGRIVLKSHLTLPQINDLANTNDNFYVFQVEYDYFESTKGHYFTVSSYRDIHYRKIPTYVDAAKNNYPLRNVIDFRPVRNPIIGSTTDYSQEVDIIGNVELDYDYYLNQNKVIALQGNGSSEIELQYSNQEIYVPSDYNIRLYDLTIAAYTFDFDDIEYKLIDNKNYTMKDISKLQKRIENLEDIAQLNALELQAIQTKLSTPTGEPRFTNGLLVDMFSGFAISKVDQEGFSASIDIDGMKMYPSFKSNNTLLEISPNATIGTTFPTKNKNIVFLPVSSETSEANTIDSTTATSENSNLSAFVNGKLSLYPFSENWYSTQSAPNVLLNIDNQFKNWKLLKNNGHKTQWGDWEQFWSGVNVDTTEVSLANATLSQKTGRMVNNKNNIEKIINDKKINTTLTFKSRQKDIGFVLQMLDADTTKQYNVYVNDTLRGISAGQKITFVSTSTASESSFKALYQGYEITQVIANVGTAYGTINHIELVSTTATSKTYNLYVTNVVTNQFVSGTNLTELNGTVSAVATYGSSTVSLDSDGILCGHFTITEGEILANSSVDVQVKDVATGVPVASNKFYFGGLLETKTSHCQSIRPVQRKLFSNTNTEYIDDKTYIINSTTRVQAPLHQTFILDSSRFLSKMKLHYNNPNATDVKVIATIQPLVNGNLSPSLVLPFSEVIVTAASGDGVLEIPYEIPVYVSSNKEYALVLRTEENLNFYTTTNTSTEIFVENVVAVNGNAPTSVVLQMEILSCIFNTNQKEMLLRPRESSFNETVDRMRLNVDSMNLTGTRTDFEWKARNYDETTQDVFYKNISPNETSVLNHRKAFTQSDFELNVKLSSSDNKFTPMLDLSRMSVTTIEHHIDNGAMLQDNVTVTRSGSITDLIQITLTERDATNVHNRICVFTVDASGTITNFYSDPNFLLFVSEYDISVRKFDSTTNLFVDYSAATISNNTITDTGLNITINVVSEYDANEVGNVSHRYYSPIVTLADDFEAMQLYVQMDTILKQTGEVFVYYRTLENSQPFDDFADQDFKIMNLKTNVADKYSNNNLARTLEFETDRDDTSDPRFKYFQVKVCFTSSNPIEIPVTENIRILALDN